MQTAPCCASPCCPLCPVTLSTQPAGLYCIQGDWKWVDRGSLGTKSYKHNPAETWLTELPSLEECSSSLSEHANVI